MNSTTFNYYFVQYLNERGIPEMAFKLQKMHMLLILLVILVKQQTVMDKAKQGYKNLIKLKTQEIEYYYLQHKDIIKPFLLLQKELQELKNKEIDVSLNFADALLKKKKNNNGE